MKIPNDQDGLDAGVANIWRRAIAFAIDMVILGVLGMAVIMACFGPLSALGERGRLVGFAIGSLYFAWFEGGPRRNQSPGKRAMKLKVIRCGERGPDHLSAAEAWSRYAIVAVPIVLHGLGFVGVPRGAPAEYPFLVLNDVFVSVWETLLVYLVLFNRPSRRSLQDLVTSSAVVSLSAERLTYTPLAREHWFRGGGLAALRIGVVLVAGHWFLQGQSVDLAALQQAVAPMNGVSVISLGTDSLHSFGNSGNTDRSWSTINVEVNDASMRSEAGARRIANALATVDAWRLPRGDVRVNVAQTAELGIARWTQGRSETVPVPRSPRFTTRAQIQAEAVAHDPQALAMLGRGDYAGLDQLLGSLQKRFEAGQLDESDLREIYRPFTVMTPVQEDALKAWVKADPNSYPAHLALGYHYKVLGWDARGDKFVSETPPKNFVAMQHWLDLSERELLLSMKLTTTPYMSVYHLQHIAQLDGDRGQSEYLLVTGTTMYPKGTLVRYRYLTSLKPRWGGSYEQMQDFIDMSRKNGVDPQCVMRMEITKEGEMAADAWRAKQYAEAHRRYLVVLDRASRLGLKSGDYVDDAHRYICGTTKDARYCEAGA